MARIVVAASMIAVVLPASAGDAGPPPAGATLRVGVPAGPDAMAGFDRSLFGEVARDAGLVAAFDVLPPEAARAELDAGRLDVAAGPFPLEGPAAHRFLAPVAQDGDALLKRRGDGSLTVPGDAAGKVLGTMGPPAEAARLRAEAAALHARTGRAPPAFADPLRDLAAGRLAAVAGSLGEVAGAALARPDGFEVVGPVFGRTARLAPMVRADRPDLALQLDAVLARMRADGRLAEMQRRWFGIAFDPPGPQSPIATSKP